MSAIRIRLTGPQFDFVSAQEAFPAFVGGFGSGKTFAAAARAVTLKLAEPRLTVAYYLPTYDLVRNIGFPRFAELLDRLGLKHKINRSDATIDVTGAGQILFRTMDTPERIIGYEVADSLVDELDTLATEKARDVWVKIMGRNRQKKAGGGANTIGVVTTPEGFRFVYERWHRDPPPGYRLIRAATMTNARNLPEGYIDSLRASYPSNLLSAYLDGEFVNLTAGSVYAEFDRRLNASSESAQPGETVHVGMDFNVGKMAAVIHVLRNGDPHAVAEFTDVFDTSAMARLLRERYKERGNPVIVYPDATGASRKSVDASQSDLAVLRQAGFTVLGNHANPAVKDRVLAFNRMICTSGERRYRVNVDGCPHLVEALEKQSYDKNGEPDKTTGLDHVVDAAGYFVVYRYPIAGQAQRARIVGI